MAALIPAALNLSFRRQGDGQWHVSQERILPDNELESDKRRGAL